MQKQSRKIYIFKDAAGEIDDKKNRVIYKILRKIL